MVDSKYEKMYSDEGFWKKIVLVLFENALCLYYAMKLGKVIFSQVAIIIASLVYLIFPIDLCPDFIPVCGYADDFAVLALAVESLACCADPEVKKLAKEKLIELFGKIEEWCRDLHFSKNLSLAVLGMDQSGKTSFYNFLQNEDPGNPDGTPVEERYREFKIRDSEGNCMTIKAGRDISGQSQYVYKFYGEMIENSDLILFLFNTAKFCSDSDYQVDVVDRIALLAEKSKSTQTIYIVPTFKDVAKYNNISESDLKRKLFAALDKDKSANRFSDSQYLFPQFQTNKTEDLVELRDRIFNKYKS